MVGRAARNLLTLVVALPAILFIVMGLRWLVNPDGIAPDFGLTLDTGLGLSTQVGNLSAFFLVTGVCMLIALVTARRAWYYPPAMLLLLTAIGRLLAWLVHGATFALQMIAVEIIVAALLLTASRFLSTRD